MPNAGEPERITETGAESAPAPSRFSGRLQSDYRYRGKSYKLLVNGHSGDVISGQAPVGKWDKVVMLSIIMAVLVLVFSLIALLADAPLMWIGTGTSAGAVGLYALWTALFSKR